MPHTYETHMLHAERELRERMADLSYVTSREPLCLGYLHAIFEPAEKRRVKPMVDTLVLRVEKPHPEIGEIVMTVTIENAEVTFSYKNGIGTLEMFMCIRAGVNSYTSVLHTVMGMINAV